MATNPTEAREKPEDDLEAQIATLRKELSTINADHGSFDPAVGVDDDIVQFTDEQHWALYKRNRLRRYSESLLRRLLGLSATIRRSAYLSRPCPLPP